MIDQKATLVQLILTQEERATLKEVVSELWVRSAVFGYVASILLVGSLLVLEKIDEYLPQAPLFTGTPFALISILTALLWGIGPALLSFLIPSATKDA